MRIIITGTAGFIGFHLAWRLLKEGHEIVGIDNFTPYYDLSLKEDRNKILQSYPAFTLYRCSLENRPALEKIFAHYSCDYCIHLAAQAGVRYSLKHPEAYIDSNILGTFNLLEILKQYPIAHFMFASTSSVYGGKLEVPFFEKDITDYPLSIYAATKKSGEVMAHAYSHLWQIPTSVFRFFSVYGPWGRPDMALFTFTKNIFSGQPIEIYNYGNLERDFTYIDDLIQAIAALMNVPPCLEQAYPGSVNEEHKDFSFPNPSERDSDDLKTEKVSSHIFPTPSTSPHTPFRIVNIGGGQPIRLMDFIEAIEKATERKALRTYKAMQPGDVLRTFANADRLESLINYKPTTSIQSGVDSFVEWYCQYYQIQKGNSHET